MNSILFRNEINESDDKSILKARGNTRLELRKQKVTQFINEKKLNPIKLNSLLFISIDQIDLQDIQLRKPSFTLSEHLDYIIYAYSVSNYNLLLHSIYLARNFLNSSQQPKDSLIYEDSLSRYLELSKILEAYCTVDVKVANELIWIFGVVLYYLSNVVYSSTIYNDKFLNCITSFLKLSNNSFEAINTSIYTIANGVSCSTNRNTLIISSFFEYIINLLKLDDLPMNVLTDCIWIFSCIVMQKPELGLEVSSI